MKSMFTESINHGPGVTFFQTGSQVPGRPSFGSWLSYGLGQENANVRLLWVPLTKGKGGQPLGAHLWGSGFCRRNMAECSSVRRKTLCYTWATQTASVRTAAANVGSSEGTTRTSTRRHAGCRNQQPD